MKSSGRPNPMQIKGSKGKASSKFKPSPMSLKGAMKTPYVKGNPMKAPKQTLWDKKHSD
jgi:hypothetical protein